MLRHVVSFKLTADDREEKVAQAAEISRRLDALIPLIPEVRRLTLGVDTGETGGNWDIVLVADYDDAAALDAYQTHPEHQKVAAFIRSLASARSCVDFSL
jgi:quinol monooxygenase YgiN